MTDAPEHVQRARDVDAAHDEGAKRAGEAGRALEQANDSRVRCGFCQEKHDGIVITSVSGAIVCAGCVDSLTAQIAAVRTAPRR